jgi:hypothetical protein
MCTFPSLNSQLHGIVLTLQPSSHTSFFDYHKWANFEFNMFNEILANPNFNMHFFTQAPLVVFPYFSYVQSNKTKNVLIKGICVIHIHVPIH